MSSGKKFSGLANADPAWIEELYEQFLSDPESVDESWRSFFTGFGFALTHFPVRKTAIGKENQLPDEFKVLSLINAYRERGHYFTQTNPVRKRRTYSPTLDVENFGLGAGDIQRKFYAGNEIGIGEATLSDITDFLKQTYCRSVGVEFMYIRNTEIVSWLKSKMEACRNTPSFSTEEKTHILRKTAEAVNFEKFVRTKFPGQKSFSLEGAEALIPALDAVIRKGASLGYGEFVLGMPHRGRLNVLANILHKSYSSIFSEFEGKPFDNEHLLGDVKYHLGFSSDYPGDDGKTSHVTLSPNPSHLEAVNPVVQGIVRAKTDLSHNGNNKRVVPVLIHGDASVAAQGIVYEIVQMSELPGYTVGGTIHLVVNNQLGFTTNYLDARSSIYCTDVAKIIQSPIFHVNGDDVEAVVYTILLAMEYRETFHKDVFIDLLCYRKYGHNESDEPRYTQPLLYKIIEKHPNPLSIYLKKLQEEGMMKADWLRDFEKQFSHLLEENFEDARRKKNAEISPFLGPLWKPYRTAREEEVLEAAVTAVSPEQFRSVGEQITQLPENLSFFRKILKLQQDRQAMVRGEIPFDWAMAELMALGTLLHEGVPVRFSGQDVKRGTFSQRHAVLTVDDSEEEYVPLSKPADKGASFSIYNSLLSEYGVLGFEYGYSLAAPGALCIWEAQFGDFNNGAQIIIDQFIASAEEKWNVMSGLVLLLPHGYEGQGPEHSSARPERFLSLCADGNMQICCPSQPANYFHLLRRQMHRDFRKPLVVFTPKSLLRHPQCVSVTDAFTRGRFMEIIDDADAVPDKTERVILCSGKIYYELEEQRKKSGILNTAILRIEQLYPFPEKLLEQILGRFTKKQWIFWVQEEPANMGAWPFLSERLRKFGCLLIARPESASPATGSSQQHRISQQKITEKALGFCHCENKLAECRMSCTPNERITQ
jgi:2-oxoglutarate dehydrogenase E1 component